eukprot:TRINITY_DN72703_c0_g1_i1.p1 TRINITY_DN72703_c0_g1~~TRINITY_DN72703_c0_g1_i1.p1  ORF type:complete len:280 (+),score=56.63 TRINITY_DN72703_c0_g1_i1:87-926(+)
MEERPPSPDETATCPCFASLHIRCNCKVEPATSCCGRQLPQGVQIIATYAVIVGTFGIVVLLARPTALVEQKSDSLAVLVWLQTCLNVFAFYAGLQGLLGCMLRHAGKLQWLLGYNVGELVFSVVALVVQELQACPEKFQPHAEHKDGSLSREDVKVDCAAERVCLVLECLIHCVFVGYCAYMVWSMSMRLGRGELRHPEDELLDRILGDSGRFVGDSMSGSELAERGLLPGGGPQRLEPYSGQAHSIGSEEEPLRAESATAATAANYLPFQGTPHRLA